MKRRVLWIMLLVMGLWMVATWAVAQEPTAPAAPAGPQKMTLLYFLKVGGWAMWPLGLCSLGMVAMAVLNFILINKKKMMPPLVLEQLKLAAHEQDLGKMLELSAHTDSLFTNSLAAGLRKLDADAPEETKPKVEAAIAETVGREEAKIGFWLNLLSLITAISPMLGLLGTVSGMIGAFQKLAAGGMGKPELLAGNIGEALITTATGLIIAIPAMFFYFLFRNLLNRIIQQAEEQFSLLMDMLMGAAVPMDVAPQPPPAGEHKP